MFTVPETVSDVGLKVAFEFAGKPLALKVMVPALEARFAENVNSVLVPAVTVALLLFGVIPKPTIVVVSEAVLLARLESLMPPTLALLTTDAGELELTLTVTV